LQDLLAEDLDLGRRGSEELDPGSRRGGAPVGGAWSWAAGAVEADGAVWGGGTAHRGLRQRPAVGAEELEDADRGVGGG
jgi:hypothetical protein